MVRTNYIIAYSGNMGNGTSSGSDYSNGWRPIAPETMAHQKHESMCMILDGEKKRKRKSSS